MTESLPVSLRDRIAPILRDAIDRQLIAEWICCNPVNREHELCSYGDDAREALGPVLADDPGFPPSRLVMDAVMAVVGPVLADRDDEIARLQDEVGIWKRAAQAESQGRTAEVADKDAEIERLKAALIHRAEADERMTELAADHVNEYAQLYAEADAWAQQLYTAWWSARIGRAKAREELECQLCLKNQAARAEAELGARTTTVAHLKNAIKDAAGERDRLNTTLTGLVEAAHGKPNDPPDDLDKLVVEQSQDPEWAAAYVTAEITSGQTALAGLARVSALLAEYETGDWGPQGTLAKIRTALDQPEEGNHG